MNSNAHPSIRIVSLGRFAAYDSKGNLLNPSRRSTKTWLLLQYLVTHRHHSVPLETIAEALWPEASGQARRQALYTSIHRLRQILTPGRDRYEPDSCIVRHGGMYRFNPQLDAWLDIDHFVQAATAGQAYMRTNPDRAREHFADVLTLYQGDYLPEKEEPWAEAPRVYYRSLFCQAVPAYLELLFRDRDYTAVCQTAQQAISLVPCGEAVHYYYLQAMLAVGDRNGAYRYAKDLATAAHKNRHIELSERLQAALLDAGIEGFLDRNEVSLESIERELAARDAVSGPFECSMAAFRLICQLEHRRLDRQKTGAALVSMAAEADDYTDADVCRALVSAAVKTVLRRGDVFCSGVDDRFLLLLANTNEAGLAAVVRRLRRSFLKQGASPFLRLHIRKRFLRTGERLEDAEAFWR